MIEEFQVLDALSQGVFCIDKDYRIIYWNRLLEFWSGISSGDALERDVFDIFPALNKGFYRLMIRQVFEAGITGLFSYQLHKNLFHFDTPNQTSLCIRSRVVRTLLPGKEKEYCLVFSLQDISGLIHQIEINKEVKDQVLELVEELRKTNEELQKAASTDPLTELFNRRSMMESLTAEQDRTKRYGTTFSLVLTDIDNFKKFNDIYGHACGDYILKELATVFRSVIRPADIVCRWGGEEFLFLLPETGAEAACQSAERLREVIADHEFRFEEKTHRVTLSFGVSSCAEGRDLNRIISNADKALYKAKEEGKNRVVLYSQKIQ